MENDYDKEIDRLIGLHEASWQRGYHKFPAVLKTMGLKRGAEIGVAFGGHAQAIIEQGGVEKLYAVDSYRHRPEYDDPMNLPQPVFDRLYKRTGERLSGLSGSCVQIRLDSVQAAEQINEPLDFVYIDGDHSYQGIREDLEAWFPKVRVGGIIAGHDYGQPAFPGVKAVVDAFFDRFGIKVHHEGVGVWWAMRPATPLALIVPSDSIRKAQLEAGQFFEVIKNTGINREDTIVFVGPDELDQAYLQAADQVANVKTIKSDQSCRPWHATQLAAEQTNCPLMMPVLFDQLDSFTGVTALRKRVVTSGALAAVRAGSTTTQDFDLRTLVAGGLPEIPVGQSIVFSSAVRRASAGLCRKFDRAKQSDRLLGWCLIMQMLAEGSRIALDAMPQCTPTKAWTAEECRAAAAALAVHADQIAALDVLRLKRPDTSSHWLNELDQRPIQLLPSVRPIDHPVVYIAPNLLDRLFHKVRRGFKQVA